MDVMVLNVGDSWNLEFGDGTVMNMDTAEHIKRSHASDCSIRRYYCRTSVCWIEDKAADQQEKVLNAFIKYAGVPIINMESALSHPLQGLTDAITIKKRSKRKDRKLFFLGHHIHEPYHMRWQTALWNP